MAEVEVNCVFESPQPAPNVPLPASSAYYSITSITIVAAAGSQVAEPP